jgi:excisionase family DNA binding protein
MPETADWLTKEQTAGWLNVPLEAVETAIHNGEIPVLPVGGHVRISREALLSRANAPAPTGQTETPTALSDETAPPAGGPLPAPAGMTWTRDLTNAPAFSHGWPRRGGGTNDETYPQAWQGAITLQGNSFNVTVGECTRHNRGRLTVFFNREPICEFTETTDGQGWASVVKPNGKQVLQASDTPPPFYRHARLVSYRETTGMTGIGVPKGLALLIDRDDYRGAVHQAAARWLGKNRFPVDPAA